MNASTYNRKQSGRTSCGQRYHIEPSKKVDDLPPFEVLLRALIPFGYGYRQRILETFRHRASYDTVRNWRRGHREPPQWAWDCLQIARAAYLAKMDELMRWLQYEAKKPRSKNNNLNAWRARRAREMDAQKEKDQREAGP